MAGLMATAAILQVSLVSKREWDGLSGRLDRFHKRSLQPARALSFSAVDAIAKMSVSFHRSSSMSITECGSSSFRLSPSATILAHALAEVREWADHVDREDDNDTSKMKSE